MKTVGGMLKEARVGKNLSLDDVEKETKIRKKFLEAIESDDYSRLPSLSYAKGFVKNYSEFLNLSTVKVLAFFRRQTQDISRTSLLPRGVVDTASFQLFRITPSRFLVLLTGGLLCTFLLYFGLQYRKLQQPPKLILESPIDNLTTSERLIEIQGVTDSDATVAINDVRIIVREDGKFFDQVALELGSNIIRVSAASRYGKITTVTRSILVR